MNLIDLCSRLIATPSVTTDGTRRIAEFCARELLAPLGIDARLLPSPAEGDAQVNLFAHIRGRDPTLAPLVWNTHLDTVAPGDPALWTECDSNPFRPSIKDGRIYGLGAADTKLDFAAKLTALSERPRPRRDIFLVGTFGEERGLKGARELAATGLLPRGAPTFVGEPSRLQVITAHKGLIVFELAIRYQPRRVEPRRDLTSLTFAGRSAHSSTPALGDNAIRKALDAVANGNALVASIDGGDAVNKVPARCEVLLASDSAAGVSRDALVASAHDSTADFVPASALRALVRFVADLESFAASAGPPDDDFAPPTLTCNPGVIRSSPGRIVLEFELRPPPSLALTDLRARVEQLADALRRDFPDTALELALERANPAFRTAPASATVELAMQALAQAGMPLATGVKTGCTEAGVYAVEAGLVPIVIGPGPSTGVIHAPNEYNFVADVEAAARFYRALLDL